MTVAALSDGLGSLEYSRDGAVAVVEAVTDMLTNRVIFDRIYAGELGEREIIGTCQNAVAAQVGRGRYGKAACTLLFVATSGERCIVGQIGDGAIYKALNTGFERLGETECGLPEGATRTVLDYDAPKRMQLFRVKLDGALGFLLTTDGLRGYAYYPISNAPAKGIQRLYSVIAQSDVQDGSHLLKASLGEISSSRFYDDLSCAVIAFGGRVPDFSFDSSWPCLCGRKNPYDSLECECGRDYDTVFSFQDSAKIIDRLLFLTSLNSAFCRYSKSPDCSWPEDFIDFIQGIKICNVDRFARDLRHLYGIPDDEKKLPKRMLSEEQIRRRVLSLVGGECSQELDALIADIRDLRIDVFRVPDFKLRRYIKVRLGVETKYLLKEPEL